MQDIFDTIEAPEKSADAGDIFDQLGEQGGGASSLSPVQAGQPVLPQSAPAQPKAQLPDALQFQQDLAAKGEEMKQRQPDTTILGAVGEVASIPFKALGAVGADILNRGRQEFAASGEGDPRIYAPRFGESEADRQERLTFGASKPLYEPQGNQLSPNGSDLQRLISQWSTPESMAMLAASEIPLGRLAMGVQMAAGAPQQVHRILSSDTTDEQKRDEINNLFAMGLLIAKGGAYPHAVHAGAEPGRPGYLSRTLGENIGSMRKEVPTVPVPPETREARVQTILEKARGSGQNWNTIPGTIEGHPLAIAHTLKDGSVVLSEEKFHHALDQELAKGVSVEEGIDNIFTHENIHGIVRTLKAKEGQPSGDEMATDFWNNMSGIEKMLFKRRLHGPKSKEKLTDLQYGHEAIQFALQRLQGMKPGEHIFGTPKEIFKSKVLTALEDVVRWIRENIGRSAKNLEYLAQLQRHINELKEGAKDASRVTSAESKAEREVRPPVGEEVPLRQQGEAAPAQEGVAEEAQVPLAEAPPAAQTGEALPAAPAEGIGKPGVAAPVGPAGASISTPASPVKPGELEALQQDVLKGKPFSMASYKRLKELTAKQVEADAKAGKLAGPQAPLAMSLKGELKEPKDIADDLGIKFRGTMRTDTKAVDQYVDANGVTVSVPNGTPHAAVEQKLYERRREFAQAVADEIGFQLSPTRQIGSMKLTGLSPEQIEKLKSFGQPPSWEFTDRRKGSPTERLTFYVPEDASPAQIREAYQKKLEEFKVAPLAMSLKESGEMTEKDLAAKLMDTVRGTVSREQKYAIVKGVFGKIAQLPKEQWPQALTEFQAKWEEATVDEANQEIASMAEGLGISQEQAQKLMQRSEEQQKIQEARTSGVLGDADRKLVARRAIYMLNLKPEPIAPSPTAKPGPVRPRYKYEGQWDSFWKSLQEDHPHIPEFAARDAYREAVQNFLSNATGAKIRELLRPARLERKFLGESLLRNIPEPDPNPILADMDQAPSPEKSIAFKKFVDARGLTVEQGLAELEKLKAQQVAEMRERADIGKERPGREAMPEADVKAQFEEWRKARGWDRKRREKAIGALSNWLIKQSTPPGRNPMRRTLDFDDVWFDSKERVGAYAEYDAEQGEDYGFLKSTLGKAAGVARQAGSKASRGVAVLVDKFTGATHAVSVYIHPTSQEPLIYDPSGIVGSKTKQHRPLGELLGQYRVKSYLLVRDPLHRFHQKWASEEVFDKELGTDAKSWENDANKQWVAYQTGVEPADVPAEEELSPDAREQIAKNLEESGGRPGEWSEEMGEGSTAEQKAQDRAAFEAWSQSPAWGKGPGSGAWGLFPTDPKRLIRGDLTSIEADSLYELVKEFKMKGPEDFDRMFQVLSGLRKIIERAKPAGRNKPKKGLEGFYLRGKDYCAVSALDKIARKKYLEWARTPEAQELFSKYPRLPKHGDYDAMTAGEKERYKLEQTRKYIALGETLDEVYALANEVRTEHAPGGKEAPAGELAAPQDTVAFRSRALDRYGDTARRNVEQAALSQERAAQHEKALGQAGGVARDITGPEPGRRVPLQGGVTAGRRFPQAQPPPSMLPPGSVPYQPEAPPPHGAFPITPTTPSNIGGEGFTGKIPEDIPERATPVATGQDKGYAPSSIPPEQGVLRPIIKGKQTRYQPSLIQEAVQGNEPVAMTLKGYGISNKAEDEMVQQGRRNPIVAATGLPKSKEQLIQEGQKLLASGKVSAEREMQQAERPGHYMGENSVAVFRAWGHLLQRNADAIAEKKGGTKTAAYKEAQAISDDWQGRIDKVVKPTAASMMHQFQGWDLFGANGEMSVTFTRRAAKAAKAASKKIPIDEVEDEGEDAFVDNMVAEHNRAVARRSDVEMAVGDEYSKAMDPVLDPGQAKLVKDFEKFTKQLGSKAGSALKKNKPTSSAMAMKDAKGELPKLDPYTEDLLGNYGMDVMAELAKNNELTDANWLSEMKKRLSSDEVDRPDLEPYLPHIRAVSEEIRDTALNNYIGTGDPVKDARGIFTRKRPPIEESITAIRRALEADPSGKRITPAEAYHLWNYLRGRFFDKLLPDGSDNPSHTMDFREIRTQASAELGIKDKLLGVTETPYPQLRLFRAMSTNRTMRKMSSDLIKAMRDEARMKANAANWLKNQEFPMWLRTARLFPRVFFFDKILGHGLVPMLTHAPTMMFNPMAYSVYFGRPDWAAKLMGKPAVKGAWAEMYRMTYGTEPLSRLAAKAGVGKWQGTKGVDYHKLAMEDLVNHERFEWWNQRKLQCNPFHLTDDYQIEALQRVFGNKMEWLTAGHGFDALKQLRLAMAEKWLNSYPEHLRNERMGDLIAKSVNHATGIVNTRFHESANWLLFAPRLWASQYAWLFKDTIKAANYAAHYRTASLEQRAWAKSELKQKAAIVGMYYGMLALNQGFLSMCGSKQKINGLPQWAGGPGADPSKSDFMCFKVAGFKVGIASPIIGIAKLLGNLSHHSFGQRTKYEKLTPRREALGKDIWDYSTGKASPLASSVLQAATAQDFQHRPIPLPWAEPLSRKQRLQGKTPYGAGEYLAEQFSPIPIQEAIKETWRSQGMDESTIAHLMKALLIGGSMAATGARVSEDEQ